MGRQAMRQAAIGSPLRAAVGGFGGALRRLTADQLASVAIESHMERTRIGPDRIDDVIRNEFWRVSPRGTGSAKPDPQARIRERSLPGNSRLVDLHLREQ